LPKTPAPAIWVVLVITDDADEPPPGDSVVHALHSAAEIAVAAAANMTGRTPLNSTGPTVTSDSLSSAACARRRRAPLQTEYDSL
jgi:hypothetical protein